MKESNLLTIINLEIVNKKVFCRCECGVEKWINIYNIKNGDVKSCGCLRKNRMKQAASERFSGKTPKNFKDWTGKKIGLCTVIKRLDSRNEMVWYLLECKCGNRFKTALSSLRRSKYKKCRCGPCNHVLKRTLNSMKSRCYNHENCCYKWYGGKGISVCNEWIKFPVKFIHWSLENGWEKGLTIDRIDSDGNYEPSNCQWTTKSRNSQKAAKERWERKNLV